MMARIQPLSATQRDKFLRDKEPEKTIASGKKAQVCTFNGGGNLIVALEIEGRYVEAGFLLSFDRFFGENSLVPHVFRDHYVDKLDQVTALQIQSDTVDPATLYDYERWSQSQWGSLQNPHGLSALFEQAMEEALG